MLLLIVDAFNWKELLGLGIRDESRGWPGGECCICLIILQFLSSSPERKERISDSRHAYLFQKKTLIYIETTYSRSNAYCSIIIGDGKRAPRSIFVLPFSCECEPEMFKLGWGMNDIFCENRLIDRRFVYHIFDMCLVISYLYIWIVYPLKWPRKGIAACVGYKWVSIDHILFSENIKVLKINVHILYCARLLIFLKRLL